MRFPGFHARKTRFDQRRMFAQIRKSTYRSIERAAITERDSDYSAIGSLSGETASNFSTVNFALSLILRILRTVSLDCKFWKMSEKTNSSSRIKFTWNVSDEYQVCKFFEVREYCRLWTVEKIQANFRSKVSNWKFKTVNFWISPTVHEWNKTVATRINRFARLNIHKFACFSNRKITCCYFRSVEPVFRNIPGCLAS